ncbi:MAG: cytochrome-c oxidase, cbb3-type subunit III [Magnetococcales bacterium]|nr:cytochrome-c oxidase, cbb3-type subunit III [Magnetococcales bacterium]MBF0321352.1 cytochrome-c oxidase, cbb3-type subunit III [Magnetococcales bacterium]
MAGDKKVETTGHQWDDEEGHPLQEYNNPLPTWWLYAFYACIVYAVIYWILFPAWPTMGSEEFTKGVLGWSNVKQLTQEMARAQEAKKPFDARLAALPLEEIAKNNDLFQYALAGGKSVFANNCVPCHGSGGTGAKGYPNLVDDDWLYDGTLADIQLSINNGRSGQMPAHLNTAGGAFGAEQVNALVEYVLKISGQAHDAALAKQGDALFHGDGACFSCHGDHGKGSLLDTVANQKLDKSVGAPNLTDAIWLYGGDRQTVHTTVASGRSGQMPAWGDGYTGLGKKLDPLDVKKVALFVHSLGGGR